MYEIESFICNNVHGVILCNLGNIELVLRIYFDIGDDNSGVSILSIYYNTQKHK